MFSANRWCVFATADALLVPRDESGDQRREAAFNRGGSRRPEMFIFEFGLNMQRDGEPVQVPAPAPPIVARLLCTIDKIDRDLERTEQPGCRTTRHFQRGKR